jgi:hydroxymethylbilane synthase
VSGAVRVATRGSPLALRQVEIVAELLGVDVEPVVVTTIGDHVPHLPLRAIAGMGAFTGDVRSALANGAADLAVHSAKDLPALDDPRFATAFPPRADARDVLVGSTLADLPAGATVATGAPRRRAQLASLRDDLRFAELRGNIGTRLARAADFDAVVVAAAALDRLGIVLEADSQHLSVDELVPQVGQGALAVDARHDDRRARRLLELVDDGPTRRAVTAERAFLATLGGDCDLPAGAHATVETPGMIRMRAVLADGRGILLRDTATGAEPEEAGVTLGERLRARLERACREAGAVA